MIYELTTENEMKHKHAELIKAWADGAIIQYKVGNDRWLYCYDNDPSWSNDTEYRIKPEPKPDLIKYIGFEDFGSKLNEFMTNEYSIMCQWENRIKLIFDGETRKLKSAEVIA